jgi:hypothetical protein
MDQRNLSAATFGVEIATLDEHTTFNETAALSAGDHQVASASVELGAVLQPSQRRTGRQPARFVAESAKVDDQTGDSLCSHRGLRPNADAESAGHSVGQVGVQLRCHGRANAAPDDQHVSRGGRCSRANGGAKDPLGIPAVHESMSTAGNWV